MTEVTSISLYRPLDNYELLDPERFVIIDYALRRYFLEERFTQGRSWASIRWQPQDYCNCITCTDRRDRRLIRLRSALNGG